MEFVPFDFIDYVVNMTCSHTYRKVGLQALSTFWGKAAETRHENCHGAHLTDVRLKLHPLDCSYSWNPLDHTLKLDLTRLELGSQDLKHYRVCVIQVDENAYSGRRFDPATRDKVIPLLTKMLRESRYPLRKLRIEVDSYREEMWDTIRLIMDAILGVQRVELVCLPSRCLPIMEKMTEGLLLLDHVQQVLPKQAEAAVLKAIRGGRLTNLVVSFREKRKWFCRQFLHAISQRNGFSALTIGCAYQKYFEEKVTMKFGFRAKFVKFDVIRWQLIVD